ncbi:hypothetical protein FRC02_007518 [Tulasnella sp. 418]|nr:hypothetical protein FRC02_007518 [Tulasnella sp. 418]
MSPRKSSKSQQPAKSTRVGTRTNPRNPGDLSVVPPEGTLKRFLWEKRVWVEATFALSMLEPWEKIIVLTVFLIASGLLVTSIYLYFPQHLSFIRRRALFYIFGDDKLSTTTASTEL